MSSPAEALPPVEFSQTFGVVTARRENAEYDATKVATAEVESHAELVREREFTFRLSGYVADRLKENKKEPDMQICEDTTVQVSAFRLSTKKKPQDVHTLIPEEGWLITTGMNHPDHKTGRALLRPDGSILLVAADQIHPQLVSEAAPTVGARRGDKVQSLLHIRVDPETDPDEPKRTLALTKLSDNIDNDAAFQWKSETKIKDSPFHKFAKPYTLEERIFQEKRMQEALAGVLIRNKIGHAPATTGPTAAPGSTPPATPTPSTGLAAPAFEAGVPGGIYVDPKGEEHARKVRDFLKYLHDLNANRGNSTDPTPESPVVDFPLPPAPSPSTASPSVFALPAGVTPEDPAAEKKAKRGEYWDKVKAVASETFVIGLELVAGTYSKRPGVALSQVSIPDILNTIIEHKYYRERAIKDGLATAETIGNVPAEDHDSLWSKLRNESAIKNDAEKIFLDLVKMLILKKGKSEKILSATVQQTAKDILKLREDCLEVLAEEKAAKARGTRS